MFDRVTVFSRAESKRMLLSRNFKASRQSVSRQIWIWMESFDGCAIDSRIFFYISQQCFRILVSALLCKITKLQLGMIHRICESKRSASFKAWFSAYNCASKFFFKKKVWIQEILSNHWMRVYFFPSFPNFLCLMILKVDLEESAIFVMYFWQTVRGERVRFLFKGYHKGRV